VMTIKSPISGDTVMSLKKDGPFEPQLRLLFSRFDGNVFPPFADITSSVDPITTLTPDPTRVDGKGGWSQVKVTCGTLESCTTVGPSEDFDGDGVPRCPATTGGAFDCNDQIGAIHPGAAEICNGMDDNCDGQIDEGNPAGGAACTIPGLLGVCAQGQTSCASGPLVCDQVNKPSADICDGQDNDCDGIVDEGYAFGGYLPPINPKGPNVFIRGIPILLRFRLADCGGHVVTTAVATEHLFNYNHGVVGSEVPCRGTGCNSYRYVPLLKQYFNILDTSRLRSGATYLLRTHLDDGTDHDVLIAVKGLNHVTTED
jgi:Putative metal-binding motif